MSQEQATPNSGAPKSTYQRVVAASYYGLLGVQPSASEREIRQAYRDLSKQYHPDTTLLPQAIATVKFQQLNEAYATLSNPERRLVYDRKIGYSRVAVVQPSISLNNPSPRYESSSAYLDPTDRPLSAGEVFALFILGITFLACLVLALAIGLTKGETILPAMLAPTQTAPTVSLEQPSVAAPEPSPALLPKLPRITDPNSLPPAERDSNSDALPESLDPHSSNET